MSTAVNSTQPLSGVPSVRSGRAAGRRSRSSESMSAFIWRGFVAVAMTK